MILVDTSVWIDHLHKSIPTLVDLLEVGQVMVHPFIVGELACGTLQRREQVLGWLERLPFADVATDDETLLYIDRYRLMGKGLSYIDAHMLASVTLTVDARLWTRDKRLKEVATSLRLASALM